MGEVRIVYSQFEEEKYILGAFKIQDADERFLTGRFLDIGACHPTDKSNTRALFELGWGGVMIEPSPVPMRNLLEAYGTETRIQLVQACVTINPGLVELHVTDDLTSTTKDAQYEQWRSTSKFIGSMIVPGLHLEYIAQKFGGFDFVNIDAEGESADLFLGTLRAGWQSKCVCVEHDGREGEIISAATPLHYHVVYGNGTNLVLVRG